MDGPLDIQIRILSEPLLLSPLRRAIEAWCEVLELSEEDRFQIGLAVDEALTNIIRHGYGGRTDGIIDVSMCRIDDQLQITIEDEARQVPISSIKGRDLDNVQPGGLGVHLIKEVMDEAVWSHGDNGGMRLKLIKSLTTSATPVMEPDHDA